MNYLLFGLLIIIFAENKFKPRVFKTIYGDWIIWFNWKGKRKFLKL